MRRLALLLAAAAVGTLLSLAALAALYHRLMLLPALLVGGMTAGIAVLVRRAWAHLPLYVGLWLDLGVVAAAALLAAVGHAMASGLPFVVLRAAELGLLSGAFALISLITAGGAYTHLRLAVEVEQQQRQVAALEQAALQSRLSALSAQVNPHFLFNTLNTLAELVHEDEDAAEDLVTDLSAIMRAALRSSTGRVPLAEELAVIRRLLRVESARLGERLRWSIDGEDVLQAADVRVPGLLIQPLVENAVKYAAAERAAGGTVRIALSREARHVRVQIADDGPGLPEDIAEELAVGTLSIRGTEGSGGGLRSCLERLTLTWPDGAARLEHVPSAVGTCLCLTLPMEETCR